MAKHSVVPVPLDSVVTKIDLSAVRYQLTRSPQAIMSADEWPAAELEYRQFLTLKRHYPGRLLIPAGSALAVWQSHILDTRAYRADCETAFGRYLDHFPFLGQQDPVDQRELAQAVRDLAELHRRHFTVANFAKSDIEPTNSDGGPVPARNVGARRRIVLVALPWQRDDHQPVPLGHASILARLKAEPALDVQSIVRPVNGDEFSAAMVAAEITEATSGINDQAVDVAIGTYVWNDRAVRDVVHHLRQSGFCGRIILGGPQITHSGTGLESLYPGVNAFVRGPGEEALCALARLDDPAFVRGAHVAGGTDRLEQADTIVENMPSPWLTEILDPGAAKSAHWETQRGCQFRCSFCQHRRAESHAPISTADPRRIRQEIELLCSARVKRISVLDPVFNRDDAHATAILRQFNERRFAGEISLQCRAELIDLENPTFLDAAERLNVTLEFGLQSIQTEELLAVERRNNLPKIEAVLDEVRRRGIDYEVTLIYGLPTQTVDSFRSSVDWCLQRRIPIIRAFPLLLLRGTKLYQQRSKWRLAVRDGLLPMVTSSSTFDESDWQAMDAIANALAATEGTHPSSVKELMHEHRENFTTRNASQLRALGRTQ